MSVHDAEPGDIYTDESGKLWRIIAVCRDPTVDAEEVEGTLYDPNAPPAIHWQGQVSSVQSVVLPRASINKRRVSGGVGGLMWNGWQRIWRDWHGPISENDDEQEV